MFSFFNQSPDKQNVRTHPKYNNVFEDIDNNIKQATEYWRHMNWSVKGEHILARLLNNINVISNDYSSMYDIVHDEYQGIINSLGFVTNMHYGKVQNKSYFYGKGCVEIIVSQKFDDALDDIFTKHYATWEPIKIIEHPFTSLDLQLANGKPRLSEENGLVVIKVDVGLLYAQYRHWRNDRSTSYYPDGTPKAITNFIHSYPIVNMLKSHIEKAWFNRLFYLGIGLPVSNQRDDTRLYLPSPYYYVDEVLTKFNTDISRSNSNFHEWCCWVPGLYHRNLKQYMIQDNVMYTQQIKLSWFLGQMRCMEWLVHMDNIAKTNANSFYYAELEKTRRYWKSSRTFDTIKGLRQEVLLPLFDESVTDKIQPPIKK